MAVSSRITSFPPFICEQGTSHSAAKHNVVKGNAKQNGPFFFPFFRSHDISG